MLPTAQASSEKENPFLSWRIMERNEFSRPGCWGIGFFFALVRCVKGEKESSHSSAFFVGRLDETKVEMVKHFTN